MNKKDIVERLNPFFLEHHELTKHRYYILLQAFIAFSRHVKDPFCMSREEFVDAYNRLADEYKPSSWNVYVSAVRTWYKWRYGGEEEYPDAVKRVKFKRVNRVDYIKRKIVSEREVKALLRAADHPRDRALIAFFRGTGARLGEGVGVRMRDVHDLAGKGFEFTVTGKTGTHLTPPMVGGYAAIIREWINFHPYRDVPESSLWLRVRGDRHVGLSPIRVYTIFQQLARNAGIKRRIHPHMMRHTQASEDARNKIPMSTRKKRHGWSVNSTMPNLYEHLTDEDGTAVYLETFGVQQAEAKREELFGLAKCVVCGEENSESSKFCSRCGTVLDEAQAKRDLERQKLIDWLVDNVLADPEARRKLFRK